MKDEARAWVDCRVSPIVMIDRACSLPLKVFVLIDEQHRACYRVIDPYFSGMTAQASSCMWLLSRPFVL